MDIRLNSSVFSPIGEPSSNIIDNSVDDIRYIQPSGAHSNSSETKALENRSVIETKTITNDELENLITEQKFSNDVHYQVEGDLYLSTDLTALPEHLSVGGFLFLHDCTDLTALPENLSVGDCLYLSGCTGLTALPEHLSVGGVLDLSGCTGLTALPEHLSVGGDLNLCGCTGLTALPNWITMLGWTDQGHIRHVYLKNTELSGALKDRLRDEQGANMAFHF